MDNDHSQDLQQQVQAAYAQATPLRIVGGNSKIFYGRTVLGEPLSVSNHQGIINYEPTELVITARAGTLLKDIEKVLDEQGQMLAFEPPALGPNATLGGTIACNLSGPRRAYAGAARDFVLGCKILNGKGEMLSFGGEVMKNVAGYDVSRLMAGALGTLGVLLEVSLKVLPKPEQETTLLFSCDAAQALQKMQAWATKPLPISASCFYDSQLLIRISGVEKAVTAATNRLGGEEQRDGDQFWRDLKEQQLGFFTQQKPLWRLSLASDAPALPFDGQWLYEWGGALRWLTSETPVDVIRPAVTALDGHASLYRQTNHVDEVFHSLPPGLLRLHHNLKQAFDPKSILNPKKMYPDI